ncbi:hypothetical protein GCM10028857_29440 [Salinarchaeum chitinilyticum]
MSVALEARPPTRLGAPVAESTLVRSALDPSSQGRGDRLVQELVEEPYVDRARDDALFPKNDPDSQALAAVRLRETWGYSTLQIEATLSRFEQAGGFAAYDETVLRRSLPSWG